VNDLESAIRFYSSLFGTPPAKVRDGYANFAIAEPPLKLVLIENPGTGGTLNHLGVEVASADEVSAAVTRLQSEGLETEFEEQTTCCYAVQDKVWVHGPDREPWEVYTVLADAPTMAEPDGSTATTPQTACCADGERVSLTRRPSCC
jgi:catechol 2,3-dioxygenase-like lactoylglutathione lyase family enzyme